MLATRFPKLHGTDETLSWTPLFEFRTRESRRSRPLWLAANPGTGNPQ